MSWLGKDLLFAFRLYECSRLFCLFDFCLLPNLEGSGWILGERVCTQPKNTRPVTGAGYTRLGLKAYRFMATAKSKPASHAMAHSAMVCLCAIGYALAAGFSQPWPKAHVGILCLAQPPLGAWVPCTCARLLTSAARYCASVKPFGCALAHAASCACA